MNKIVIALLIVAVILGECVAAFFFLGRGGQPANAAPATPAAAPEHAAPAADKHDKHEKAEDKEHGSKGHGAPEKKGHGAAEKKGHSAAEKKGHKSDDKHGDDHAAAPPSHDGQKEVDLDEFSIMASDPASNSMVMVEFHMFGIIAEADQDDFDGRYTENRHRIRHHVIMTVRSAEMADLTDAGLTLLRRQIQDKVNQLLGKPVLQEILFSKFSFIEQ